MLVDLVEQAWVCLSFHPKDVAELNAVAPESVWKTLTQSSGYEPRVTSREKVLTADHTPEVCALLP